ncbi:hypothetical protein L226DRAFT_391279 [Lentinus tigrinus ALCF2SS1-7]|uniref:Uncharacterized protein n=1 Tax=Lentinus tigrinus ALCF2SS1-6 TaxID=1328759 RepID=A0A5C2SBV2_9APHY|nr:hypothetical protein L227DRAFT_93051 [Lentinus tigrinus ALCF2SS1-6]RPD75881.1 hypothetical protein L226DRAFT_391279 [Lentinus tigrinus ALCF2SS1-7]
MLIRLSGPEPPNILFNLTYPDIEFSDKLPCPASWMMQLNMVRDFEDDGFNVESPEDVHTLDKAVWQSVVITEIDFDIVAREVKCTLLDKSTVEWSLSTSGTDAACIAALRSVITDVQDASEHTVQHSQSAFLPGPSSIPQPLAPTPVSSSASKHKRQRSLFSSIVAAVKGALSDNGNRGPTLPTSLPPLKIPSHSSHHCRTSSTFSRTQRSPPASPIVSEPPPPPPRPVFQLQVRPREPIPLPPHVKHRSLSEQLKHKARSSLVDIVRRYVYPVFSLTGSPSFAKVQNAPEWIAQTYGFPPGQFPAWALKSILRKTEERMRLMMSEANANGMEQAFDAAYRHRQAATPMLEQDDEDDTTSASTSASATSVSTETDGSSVHTPTDSPVRSPFAPGIASPSNDLPRLSPLQTKLLPQVPRSPSPPSPTYDFDISTYHTLSAIRTRILSMLTTMDSSPRQILSGPRHGTDLTILEIKSRRRAWSSRDYVGGARLSLLGLATPFRSSPLARCEPVTAETVARMQAQAARETERSTLVANRSFVGLGDLSAEFGVTVGVRAVTKEMDARLFPLSEEDEEGEFESRSAPEYQSGYSLDEYAEDEGWRDMQEFDLESGLLAFPRPEPPSAPPVYSHMHPMVRTRTTSMRKDQRLPPASLVQQRGQGGLSSNSLLCQPLNVKVPVPVMLDSSDPFAEDDYARSGEFTLSMDLPPPPRGWYGQERTVR